MQGTCSKIIYGGTLDVNIRLLIKPKEGKEAFEKQVFRCAEIIVMSCANHTEYPQEH